MGRRCTKRNGYKGRHFLYVIIMVQVECAPSKPSARRPSRVRAAQAACPSLTSGVPRSGRVQLVSTKQPCTDVYKGEGKVRLSTVTTIRLNNTYTFSANLPCNNNKMSDARRKAAEKERKKDWKRPMTAMLDFELGSGWQRRLDPG